MSNDLDTIKHIYIAQGMAHVAVGNSLRTAAQNERGDTFRVLVALAEAHAAAALRMRSAVETLNTQS